MLILNYKQIFWQELITKKGRRQFYSMNMNRGRSFILLFLNSGSGSYVRKEIPIKILSIISAAG